MKSQHKTEQGSVFFIIFIGIALFAALSFVVSNMMREGSPDMVTRQKAQLTADEIVDYARAVREAAQSVQISNACSDTEVSFTSAAGDAYEHASERQDCQIFHALGAGMTPQIQGPGNRSWIFQGGPQIFNIGSNGTAAASGELLILIEVPTDEVCDAINKKLGLAPDIDGDTLPATLAAGTKFNGSYNVAGVIGDTIAPQLKGSHAGCLDHDTSSVPSLFYQVLLAR